MSEFEKENTEETEEKQQVAVGFHHLGGIRLVAPDVKLSPQEAFVLAGQLQAHAVMLIEMSYAEQAAEAAAIAEIMKNGKGGIITPPGVR